MPTQADQSAAAEVTVVTRRALRGHRAGVGGVLNRLRHVRFITPVVLAVFLSAVASSAIVVLLVRADASRQAQIKLDDVATDVIQLQNMPWRLASSSSQSPAQIAAAMAVLKSSTLSRLSALRRDAYVRELAPLGGLLRTNFALLGTELALLGQHRTNGAQAIEPHRFHTQDRIVVALDRADRAYHARAVRSETEAAVGGGAIALLLLGGFLFFFARAFLARETADRLVRQLGESQQHLEEAQHLAGIGSWEWDFDTQAFLCSEEQLRLHGWTDQETLTSVEALLVAVDPIDRERVRSELVRPFEPGETISLEYQVPQPEGTRLIHLEAKTVTNEQDAPGGLIGTCQDVSDRFRRLEAERANRAKSDFMSRMSHELRTPLNAILGFGQLLRADGVDEQRRAANVERILTAGEHLLGLINELLEIAHIDTGGLELFTEPTLVGGLISEAIDQVRPEAGLRAIEICVDLDGADAWVAVDRERLRQVLMRLLSNAVRYNREGGHVNVRLSADDHSVAIAVADDGPGIPPDKLTRIFEPFERHGAERTEVQGAGLGLALSKGVVDAMGGTITVVSDGRGTSVTIGLLRVDHGLRADEMTPPATYSSPDPGQVVLCIDDNQSNLILIEQILSMRSAVELLSADCGQQGLRLANERQPQLILLDLNLPDINGSEVLARLKAADRTRQIPVIVLSAEAAPEQQQSLVAGGADGYLTKPIDVPELLALVDQTLVAGRGDRL
jgi:signal transduction histidine kinase/ActR/RegA family two-component response regulator